MKKRLLSALLALALVFVLLPTTALAGVTTGSDYDISINGKKYVFSDSETCYFKSSFTTTEPSSPYLKLTKNSNTITVTVSGYVTVSDINVHNNFSTQDKINLIITGNKGSTLNIECKDTYGAALETYQSGDITIKGGITVNANFSADNTDKYTDCYGIRASKNLIITGKGTTVNAVNADDAAAVKVDGNITVSDGAQLKATNKYSKKVTNYTGNAYAIECGGLSISGNNTKVTADTSNGKQAISGTVSDGDKLTFKVPLAGSTLYQKPMDEALKYKHVEITRAPTDPYVRIAGEPAIMDQETPIPGGTGTYLYKKTTYNGSFLTLKGVDITGTSSGPAQAIRFGKNGYYTIKLEGENKISGFSSGIVAPNDSGVNDVTVVLSGSGSLDISANQYAIDMQVGNLKFENTGKIMLTTGHNYVKPLNALHVAGSIFIDKAKYDIVGVKQDKDGTREDISDNPNLETILKGTSTDEDLYFKSITITPAAAKPSTIRYNGTTLKQGETIKDGKGGTATVDRENNTITLKNFNGTAALSFEATLADSTLVLEGTNTLSSIVTTQKGLTISGSGSLTVGSIRVTNNDNISADLTINGGAHVTVGTAELTTRAIDVNGSLTVTGASLTATSKSDNVPTVQVGGNATFTGSTVTITNNSTALHKDAADTTKGDSVSSALYVKGNINTDNAKVTAKVENGGGNAIGAVGNITVNGSTVTAVNKGQKFTTIIAENVYVSGDSKITANNLNENPVYNGSYLAFPAIEGNIVNQNTDYSLKFKGQHNGTSEPKTTLAPGEQATLSYYNVTITRGDEVTRTQSPVVIAGTTLRNDTYYTITNGSTVAEGTENNYNAFYDSATKTLKLNNAQISHSFAYEDGGGQDGAIIFKEFENYFIELSGENTISSTNTYAINCHRPDRTLTIKNAAEAENAKLTLTSNWMVICSIGGLNIQSDVTMVNTKRADYLMYVNGTFSYTGYNAYASTEASGSPLEVYNPENYSTYKYLRVTTLTLETGGGSTHQHVEGPWEADTQGGHHIKKCTKCGEVMISEEHRYNYTYESPTTHKVNCGVCGVNFVRAHSYTDSYVPTVDGTQHHGKCICGAEETTLRDHVFVNGVCVCGVTQSGGDPTPDVPTAPTGLVGVAPTSENGNGKITGTTAQMEYATSLEGDWTACANDSTDVPAGKYYVRMKKTDNTPAGEAVEVTVPAYSGTGEIVPPTPDNPGTIVIIRPAEEEKPAQQPNPSTGANDLVGLAVAAAVAAALGSAALLRKHD